VGLAEYVAVGVIVRVALATGLASDPVGGTRWQAPAMTAAVMAQATSTDGPALRTPEDYCGGVGLTLFSCSKGSRRSTRTCRC